MSQFTEEHGKSGKWWLRYMCLRPNEKRIVQEVVRNEIRLNADNRPDAILEAQKILKDILTGKKEGKAALHISPEGKSGYHFIIIAEPQVYTKQYL